MNSDSGRKALGDLDVLETSGIVQARISYDCELPWVKLDTARRRTTPKAR
jgi:hypothetical protein